MRRLIAPLLAVVIMVAAVIATSRYLSDDSGEGLLVVTEVRGSVTFESAEGQRGDVVPGQVLGVDERVRTGADSVAVLSAGQDAIVRIEPGSEVRITEVTKDSVRLELENGLVRADVRRGTRSVAVTHQGREVMATDAAFDFGLEGGRLVMQSTRGDVMTKGLPSGHLAEGQRVTVTEDGESVVGEIPENLLLSVSWPEQRRTNKAMVRLLGSTEPAASIRVSSGGRVVEAVADRSGKFQVDVPLAEGRGEVVVIAESLMGDQVTDRGILEVDTKAPVLVGGVEQPP